MVEVRQPGRLFQQRGRHRRTLKKCSAYGCRYGLVAHDSSNNSDGGLVSACSRQIQEPFSFEIYHMTGVGGVLANPEPTGFCLSVLSGYTGCAKCGLRQGKTLY
ncbi:hypothetical protein D3C85_772040 [compost metagenome]